MLTMKGVGATTSPCSVGEGLAIICPSLGLPLWFPICSYLNKKNILFWTRVILWCVSL